MDKHTVHERRTMVFLHPLATAGAHQCKKCDVSIADSQRFVVQLQRVSELERVSVFPSVSRSLHRPTLEACCFSVNISLSFSLAPPSGILLLRCGMTRRTCLPHSLGQREWNEVVDSGYHSTQHHQWASVVITRLLPPVGSGTLCAQVICRSHQNCN